MGRMITYLCVWGGAVMNISQFHYAKGFFLRGNYLTRARVEGFGVLSVRIQGLGFPPGE